MTTDSTRNEQSKRRISCVNEKLAQDLIPDISDKVE